jgi:hypothetical protein
LIHVTRTRRGRPRSMLDLHGKEGVKNEKLRKERHIERKTKRNKIEHRYDI